MGRDRHRVFLFLQGPSSLIFPRIADHLRAAGHRCLRINLNTGDWLFWRRAGAANYRGSLEAWPVYVTAFIAREGVTDLVFVGEQRPHHLAAIAAAHAAGASAFGIDMGYLRPDWIRLERDGGGYNSHLPSDPEAILAAGMALPPADPVRRYSQTFVADAGLDLLYNLSNVFFWFLYPGYRWHMIYHPLAEYRGWIGRLLTGRRRAREAARTIEIVLSDANPFFVFPLQLETDYQIRAYSSFASQRDALALVIASFARSAPPRARLLFKLHPLDNGLIDWGAIVEETAMSHGIGDRILFADGGNLAEMLRSARGIVTINSTVGIEALQAGCPVKVLAIAIYDVEGLTDPAPLDDYWSAPRPPDPRLADAFLRLVAATVHVRGNFYSFAGAEAGAAAIARRLDKDDVNEPGGYVAVPPRRPPVTSKAIS